MTATLTPTEQKTEALVIHFGPALKKMEEYVANGAQLGWLLDPFERKVYVYRPHAAVEILDDPQTVSGEPLLRGFTLDVRALWE